MSDYEPTAARRSAYETDYTDPKDCPAWEQGDERPSNTSANPTFYDVVDARTSRRGFLVGGLAVIATGLFGSKLGVRESLAQSTSSSALLGFSPVPLSTDDTVVVPEGYRVQFFIPHGAPLDGSADSAQPMIEASADEQAEMIGTHHDGIHYFPIDGSSTDGLLVLNHEYVDPRFMHTSYLGKPVEGDEVIIENGVRPAEEVLKEIHAHGVSVVRVQGDDNGQWRVVDDPHNRRIHGLTEIEISGPARGSEHLVTKFSPDGTRTRGTLNNCAHGVTPWNTYMAAEENWAGYFRNGDMEDQKPALPREHERYGVPTGQGRYAWELADSGADEFVRYDASKKADDATGDYRNEPNTYGWMVEIDPFNPDAAPIKRTHLGRFAHEGVVFAPAVAGQPVVCYSGDDSRFEYIYKFVSADAYVPGEPDGSILDSGTLYVAKFNDDGTGEWLALVPGENGLTPENGFSDLADILVNTRAAADLAGATKMDRPEWGTVDPNSGEVYFTLTNNTRRALNQTDAVNPRAENTYGQIVRWTEAGGDHASTNFEWNLFVIAGNQANSEVFTGDALSDDSTFACPDGIWCDPDSRLWIQTDMGDRGAPFSGVLGEFGTNAMLAADPATGEIRRFLTGPHGQEITGVISTPDQRTMFVNVQHPGGHASAEDYAAGNYGSGFPDYDGSVPRSATLVITREDGGVIGA